MDKIAKFAVKNPVTILMFVLGIALLGFISLGKLGTDLFPDLNNPKIYIELKAGEKPPEEIEKNFVDQIESLSMRQSDVTGVSSVSKNGSALITVEYDWKKDMDEAFLNLQKELNSYAQNTELDEFTISLYDPNAAPVMVVALKNDQITDMDELRLTAQNYIRNELIRIDGIADIRLSGEEESEVVIETNNYLLEAYGISSDIIATQISNYNRNVSGGSILDLGTRYTIKGVTLLEDLEDLKNIIVAFKEPENAAPSSISSYSASTPGESRDNSGNVPVYLKDVASVSFKNKEAKNMVTVNGERCVSLSIYKEPKFNTVDAVKSLDEAFNDLAKALPGYQFIKIEDQGSYISGAIGEVRNTLLIGILLAVFVLYIFLRRIGTTLVISIAIPVSIIATFNLLYFNHLTLNIMTLGGLALGAGMLVDNAIVVLENITRLRNTGLPLIEAIIKGTGEVGSAITASTLTTIVVFLPIVYLHGASGALFKDMAWTVAFSLISSLLIALMVIPMLVSVFFPKTDVPEKQSSGITYYGYSKFLGKVVDKRGLVILLATILMGGTALLIPKLGSEFMPKTESNEFTVNITLPIGTSLERTFATASNAEEIIKELLGDKLDLMYLQAGEDNVSTVTTDNKSEGENSASIKVILGSGYTGLTEEAITMVDSFLSTIPDMEVGYTRKESALQTTLGTSGSPFVLEISGEEYSELEKLLFEARNSLEGTTGLYNITTSIDQGTPEIEVEVDRFKASYYNATVASVTSQISNYLQGSQAGSFEKDGELKDITIKLDEISLSQLKDMKITAGNATVPLSEIADIKTVTSPVEVTRNNQARTVYLYADVSQESSFNKIVAEAQEKLNPIILPQNYKMNITGEELKRQESMSSLTFALILSLVLVFMVLAAQFESLLQPFIIMFTIPFAGVGTILTFFLLGKSLNMMAYIGIIMLAGIAVNNATILVDRINQLREKGLSKRDAIIEAGSQRIRPIIMTSLTTILALLPLTLGIGESTALRAPMALAVISGLITSTILTLIVIPSVYWVLDSLSAMILGKKEVNHEETKTIKNIN
jgi:HAE1 family hydrophobic/amphiphilic exporter-1